MNILVPIDESRFSRSAIKHAIALASRAPRPVTLVGLHIVNVTRTRGRLLKDIAGLLGAEPMVVPERVEQHFVQRGAALLEAFAAQAAAAGVTARTELDRGAVAERLGQHAAAHDLVMMAVHGETEEEFPGQGGGTAERVVRRLVTDALLLPDEWGLPGEGRLADDIAVGFDGSEGSMLALRAAARLAVLTGGSIHVFHVASESPDADPLDEARRRLTDLGVHGRCTRITGVPHEALVVAAVAAGCGTLAIGYRGRSHLKDLFLGRTTEHLLGRVPVALLVAR